MTRSVMYGELARWWPLLSAPAEYEEEAGFYLRTLLEACDVAPSTLLELGSGGGNNASWLKARLRCTLVDLSPAMLGVSRGLNPECEHVEGDMRDLRLGRTFGCVFVHDAVMYMTTEAELADVARTAFVHCAPGGAALFAPDFVRETFAATTDCGGHDAPDGRGLRYLAWSWDPDPADATFVTDYAFLLREADGAVRVEHDRHVEGLFPRATWLRVLEAAGFAVEPVPFRHSEVERELEVFVGRRAG